MPLRATWLMACLAVLALATAGHAHAQARTWALDPVHTRVVFAIDHAGFSKSLGTFSGATGTLAFDPDGWDDARLEVSIPIASLDLGDDKWNRATLARNLLDADTHPTARFVSTRIEPLDARRAIVHGLLTLRGATREVALDVTVNAVKRHPMPPFRRTAGFSATTTISRSDFGIDAWKSMVGDSVELRIEAEATLARGGTDGDAPDPPPAADADTPSEPSHPPDPEPTP